MNFFNNFAYSFQFLRCLAAASVDAADINECFIAQSQIKENDDESWFAAWNNLAVRIENEAAQSERKHHTESACTAYSRASNYYRAAEFFLHTNPSDPRILPNAAKSRDCFEKASKYFSHPIQKIQIPFESTALPGYLCLVDDDEIHPLLIVQTGFDGTKEELYYWIARPAIQRGYHCLIFEGPGQGEMIREQNIPFRPNWETVITPVVDYAVTLKKINPEKIALMGISMGGYLVPRALAFEKRIKVGIANGGVFDFHEVCTQEAPPEIEAILDNPEAAKQMDEEVQKIMKSNAELRWAIGHGMYVFHAKTPSEFTRMTRPYTLKGLAENIKCKMLVVDSEEEKQMKGQAKKLYDALTCPKEFMLFKTSEGGGPHCQVGGYVFSNEKIFNWLDENL